MVNGVIVNEMIGPLPLISSNLHIKTKVIISISKALNRLVDYLKKLGILEVHGEMRVKVSRMKRI